MKNKINVETKLLILSDIHLERLNEVKQKFLLNSINERVSEIRNNGFNPLVVFAGDVNNSTKGYEFMKLINSRIVYIAGNHEFWDGDYYETIQKLKNEAPENVKFLHNDIVNSDQYIILGTTLWTDIGKNLNKDLIIHAGSRMNDMSYITAKDWYNNPENIKKLEDIYVGYNINEKIKQKKWNALIEREENEVAWDFLNCSDNVLKAIKKVSEIHKKSEKDLQSKQSWWRIDKKIFAETQHKINLKEKGLTWEVFINNLVNLYKNYSISQEEKRNFLKDIEKKNLIFQKIRYIENIEDKEIIVLSHHLPFYEEGLVGTIQNNYSNNQIKLHNQFDINIFLVRNGEDYPEFNYLLRSSKGDIERYRDITHIINYYNDGSNKLGSFLLENISLWIHGHEHHFRYTDYVKGIKIIANPSGTLLGVLDIKDDELKINPHYLIYNKIKEENQFQEIEKIKKALIVTYEPTIEKEHLKEAVQLWALKNYRWEEHLKILHKIEKASKELLILTIEYLKKNDNSNEQSESLENLEESISFWNDIYNYNCQKLEKLHQELILAFSVRVEKKFNFQSYGTNSIMTMIDISNWTMGNASAPEVIENGVIGIFSAKKSFETKANLKLAIKYAEKIQIFLNTKNIRYVYQVNKKDIEEFDKLYSVSLEKEKVMEKINDKWEMFISKILNDTANNKDNLNI